MGDDQATTEQNKNFESRIKDLAATCDETSVGTAEDTQLRGLKQLQRGGDGHRGGTSSQPGRRAARAPPAKLGISALGAKSIICLPGLGEGQSSGPGGSRELALRALPASTAHGLGRRFRVPPQCGVSPRAPPSPPSRA